MRLVQVRSLSLRIALYGALCGFIGAGHAADAASAPPGKASGPPSLAAMTHPAGVVSMRLSPDGKRIAGIVYNGVRYAVYLMDVGEYKPRTLVLNKRYLRSPIDVHWVEADLLAIDFNDREAHSFDLAGEHVAKLGEETIRRASGDPKAPAELLVYHDVKDKSVARVDARTGQRERYRVALSGQVVGNIFDSNGRLRVVTTLESSVFKDKGKLSHWYRSDDAAPWQLLDSFGLVEEAWWPVGVLDAPDTLAIHSRQDRDTWAIFRYDAARRARGEMMAGHPTEDIGGATAADRDWLFASVVTDGLKRVRHWFEPRMASLQASVDAALPGRVNSLSPVRGERMLIFSHADVDPGRWFLLDLETKRLRELESMRPQVAPEQMRPQQTLTYTARDGLALHAYLTLPAPASAPPPLVVLIHGGPRVRDHWRWDMEVQILATRGYAVFQPQFRGSTGFGRKYEQAGYGQWGLAMQDDITDGVRHLIAQGLVDPARVCISGGSYGGYAALWGMIKTPELYRCGISFAGVSDLADFTSNSFFTDSTAASREVNRFYIGDPDKQRKELQEVSPVFHAERVQGPLLILHGEDDFRVPISHSRRMVRALEQNGKDVTFHAYAGAGHGLGYIHHQLHYYETMLAFLQKHLGGGGGDAPAKR